MPDLAPSLRQAVCALSLWLGAAACALDPDNDRDPPPLPPGTAIAFVTGGLFNNTDVYYLSADASQFLNLTSHAAVDTWPQWSPDGTRIAFESDRQDLMGEIYLMDDDGTNVRRITGADSGFVDAQPTWSPGGDLLAFVSNRDTATGRLDIYIMNDSGQPFRRLTSDSANDVQPAWSPDGTLIAFVSDRDDGGAGDIFVIDTSGANPVNLTNNAARDLTPAWSPDGSRIAFMSNRGGGTFAIWVMDADGGNQARVTPTTLTTHAELPSWSPDGERILLDSDGDLWTIRPDGTDLVNLTRSRNRIEAQARWRPAP